MTAAAPRLTQTEAQWRQSRISKVRYEPLISLYEKSKKYTGSVAISFSLNDNKNNIPLDFRDGKVKRLIVNKTDVKSIIHHNGKIILPKETLRLGENELVVDFEQNFTNLGVGIHKFTDPIDQNEYIYSQFEAYDGNRFFPMFDQPDLKATFNLTITAPNLWEVVSTTLPKSVLKDTNVRKRWIFETTPLMSTYLLSLHAGPFHVWKSQYKNIPLRLFVRKTLSRYVPSNDWFQLTKNGLEFYEKYFDYPYPFKKYDQILVPEFSSEAMENIAAVTFTEDYIKRGKTTREERLLIANTLLHEMAHMWFGNLVTMKWWSGLWLNESFASYMASLALAKSTQFEEAWLDFHEFKQWAYHEDQLITTHPIEASVHSTEDAFSNFDGITYAKGASVLKQLSFYLGERVFQKGVQSYFKKHQYQNTELADFIGALSEASNINLQSWATLWLQQEGIDRVYAKAICDGAVLREVSLDLKSDKKIKPHRLEIALINEDKGKLKVTNIVSSALIGSEVAVKDFKNIACPMMIYANANDNDYVKIILDENTVKILKTNIGRIHDDHLRLMLWNDLWQMVLDQKMALSDYAEMVKQNWDLEKNQKILNQIARSTVGPDSSVAFFWPASTSSEIERRTQIIRDFEIQIYDNFLKSKTQDLKLYWYDTLVHISETPAGLKLLANLITKDSSVSLDIDRQWAAYLKLCMYNWQDISLLEKKFLAKDSSDRAKNNVLACQVAKPIEDSKKDFLKTVLNEPEKYSMEQLKNVLGMMFPRSQKKFKQEFKSEIYSYIKERIQKRDEEYQARFTSSLVPTLCNEADNKELKNFIEGNKALSPIVSKELKIAWQEDERCVKISEMARAQTLVQ